jgi:hypothetical protein
MRHPAPAAATLLALVLAAAGCGPGGGSAPVAESGGAPAAPAAGQPGPDAEARRLVHQRLLFDLFNRIPRSPAKEEGLESADGWKPASWEDAAELKRVSDERAGNSLLVLSTTGGEKGKCAAVFTRDLRLAPEGTLRAAVYNHGSRAIKAAVAFWLSESSWVYYESRAQAVPVGKWTVLSFDLNAADYKTASSKWKHNASLWKREETKQLALLVYHGGGGARVILDGLTVDQAPAPPPAPEKEKKTEAAAEEAPVKKD